MRRSIVPVVSSLLLALALSGCGSDEAASTSDPGPAATPAATPTPSPAPVAAGSSEPESESAPPTTSQPIRFPEDVTAPVQGGDYVAVVLASGADNEIQTSLTSVAAYGYTAGVSDVGCLQGVSERLDVPADALISSLLFEDQRTARQFADAYIAAEDGSMVGRAAVTAYCLD